MNNWYEFLVCPVHGLPAILLSAGHSGLQMMVWWCRKWHTALKEE